MSRNTENSNSYEDIVRQTVLDPDSSQRPTRAQERAAREGFRAMDADETQLHHRVAQALAGVPEMASVSVEVTRDLVTLRGRVTAAESLRTLEDMVAAVPGVGTIHNQVVVGAGS